ncbi:MAG: LamG-like jellyroll fold domain-containing protein [Planctomycetota bacterium]
MRKIISIVLVLALCMVAETAKADFTFGTPTSLGQTVNSSYNDHNPSISADGLSLYFISNRTGGVGGTGMYAGCDIWVTTRETIDDPWDTPVNLGPPINSTVGEFGVSISANGLSLYFDAIPPGSPGAEDLYVATRATIDDDWSNPVSLGPTVNSSADDCYVNISADELALYFVANRSGGYGGYDLWVTKRETIYSPWGAPENLGPNVNTSSGEGHPGISPDGRVFFFVSSSRPGGFGNEDIWMTRRATTIDEWGEPVNLGSTINSSVWEGFPNVSADGSTLYYRYSQTGRYQGGDIWQVPIISIVDFNGDGIVDAADMSIMVDHWGMDEPLCDVGPMPWGDGVVDVQDLIALSEHLFQDINDPTLAAHWPLDETEGMLVTDSAGDNDGYALGDPVWQPAGGIVGGALEFDGIDDFISAPAVLNPANGPFSVLAWVRGGAPGQAIISETGGTACLSLDLTAGHLITELASGGRSAAPLLSQTAIDDGNWHRIGLVWDGLHRILYVDGAVVAEDTQNNLQSQENGLYIGCGNPMQPGTFFSGLIDDIRIYNRAVTP